MSKSLLTLVAAILLGSGFAASTSALHGADAPATQPAVDPKPVNSKCPITGEDVDPKVTTVYESKTVGFCCADCIKAFKKDPAKYADKLK